MLRLLVVIVIIGIAGSILWRELVGGGAGEGPAPAVIQNEQMRKAAALEQQLQDDLDARGKEIDRQSR